jgi:membrane-bound ClpP family serine protease
MRVILGLSGLSPLAAVATYRVLGDPIVAILVVALGLVTLLGILSPGSVGPRRATRTF